MMSSSSDDSSTTVPPDERLDHVPEVCREAMRVILHPATTRVERVAAFVELTGKLDELARWYAQDEREARRVFGDLGTVYGGSTRAAELHAEARRVATMKYAALRTRFSVIVTVGDALAKGKPSIERLVVAIEPDLIDLTVARPISRDGDRGALRPKDRFG